MNDDLAQRFTEDYAHVRERLASALVGSESAGEDASAILHKMILLAFMEEAGLLDGGAPAEPDEDGRLYTRVLMPRVEQVRRDFGAIAESLPGIAVSDEALCEAFVFLFRYRFRLREEDGAITPDLLGYIQERFIDQREHGSFYTRPDMARSTAQWVIREAVAARWGTGTPGCCLDKEIEAADGRRLTELWALLGSFAVIDPSCGSGAFLVAAFDVLLEIQLAVYRGLQRCGVLDRGREPQDVLLTLARNARRCLYGVELCSGAAEVARMRLFPKVLSWGGENPDLAEDNGVTAGRIVTGNALVGLLTEGTAAVQFDLFSDFRAEEWLDRQLLAEFRAAKAQVEEPVIDAEGNVKRTRRRNVQLSDIHALKPVHWAEAFPEVFARGGFDAVLGNPPWDSFRANTKEWAAKRNPRVSTRSMSADEFAPIWKEMLKDPKTRADWAEFSSGFSHVVKWWAATEHLGTGESGRMVSVNLYPLFCRQVHNILRAGGLAGYVVPSGVLTDAACARFREVLFSDGDLRWAFATYNFGAFEGVADRFRFAVLCFGKGRPIGRFQLTADWERGAVDRLHIWLDAGRTSWTPDEIRAIYPDTLSIPLVRDAEDVDVLSTVAWHRPAGYVADRTGCGPKRRRTPAFHRATRVKEAILL